MIFEIGKKIHRKANMDIWIFLFLSSQIGQGKYQICYCDNYPR